MHPSWAGSPYLSPASTPAGPSLALGSSQALETPGAAARPPPRSQSTPLPATVTATVLPDTAKPPLGAKLTPKRTPLQKGQPHCVQKRACRRGPKALTLAGIDGPWDLPTELPNGSLGPGTERSVGGGQEAPG